MFRFIGPCLLFAATFSNGQSDTLIRIHLPSGTSEPFFKTYTGIEQFTRPDARSLPPNILPDKLPSLNVMEGTHFSIAVPVDKSLDVPRFPASTSVQLIMYKEKKRAGQCSGTLVGPNLVLSSAHCLLRPGNGFSGCDEVIVAAAGKNLVDGSLLLTRATAAYVPKTYLLTAVSEDIMLLELLDPLGDHTGWMGTAFLADDQVNNAVFHKFSYPAQEEGNQRTSKEKTLHYNYGAIDVLTNNLLGIATGEANATAGQSGSSLFTIENGLPYATGVAIFARRYQHQRITKSILKAFKPIIDQSVSQANDIPFLLYPNPVSHYAAIKTTESLDSFTLLISNSEGALVRTQSGSNSNTFILDRGSLPAGDYLFRIVDDRQRRISGSFRIE